MAPGDDALAIPNSIGRFAVVGVATFLELQGEVQVAMLSTNDNVDGDVLVDVDAVGINNVDQRRQHQSAHKYCASSECVNVRK
mmetsp:Transcript_29321/g.41227  ORF Transcript_29321/g.41227 Transcript_29321/m.41227 type:complete len:83 (+) Transcript_29321:1462-1710(+)